MPGGRSGRNSLSTLGCRFPGKRVPNLHTPAFEPSCQLSTINKSDPFPATAARDQHGRQASFRIRVVAKAVQSAGGNAKEGMDVTGAQRNGHGEVP